MASAQTIRLDDHCIDHIRIAFKLKHVQVELTRHDDIHFVAIGDWGSGHHHQEEVAEAIGEFCSRNRCDFIISTGDNMYTTGVDSPFDEKFDEKWKDVYTHSSIAHLPW